MIKAINKRIRNKKGFTLIELIVVLAVLGIIAAIAVPKFTGIQEDAKVKADIATARSLAKATEIALATGDISVPASGDGDYTVEIDDDLIDNNHLDADPSAQKEGEHNFTVTVEEVSGDIIVKYTTGGDTLYPTN